MLVWFIPAVLTLVVVAMNRARVAAEEWGEEVKAAFDLYLPKLRTTIELPAQADLERERNQWKTFSQAITFRLPSSLPQRNTHRPEEDKEDSD